MKTLKEALISKDKRNWASANDEIYCVVCYDDDLSLDHAKELTKVKTKDWVVVYVGLKSDFLKYSKDLEDMTVDIGEVKDKRLSIKDVIKYLENHDWLYEADRKLCKKMYIIKEALISKDKRKWAFANKRNKYGITEKDMIGELTGFPLGVVVKMMEEQEKQKNTPDVKVFQQRRIRDAKFGGFHWLDTEDGEIFWENVIKKCEFDMFFNKYPEYKKYDM